MKARFFCALILLMALLVPQDAHADARYAFASEALVRLQVRAASDSEEDQAVKLKVRDAVRAQAAVLAAGADSPDEAFALLAASRHELRLAALAAARRAGYRGDVTVETKRIRFPLRIYGDVLVPPGEYRALRVTLGSGEGRNWWCVVYPDLCATDALASQALREKQPIRFYSSTLKLLGEWFHEGDAQ